MWTHCFSLSTGSHIYHICLFSRFVFYSGKDTEATRRNFSIPVQVINQCQALQRSVNIKQKCCEGKCELDTTAAAPREHQSIMFPTYFTTWYVKDNALTQNQNICLWEWHDILFFGNATALDRLQSIKVGCSSSKYSWTISSRTELILGVFFKIKWFM